MARSSSWLSRRPITQTAFLATTASIGYIITYFIRYPLFVLPSEGKLGGMAVKTWYSLASNVGYGVSKIPAYYLVSTYRRDQRCRLLLTLCSLMLITMVGFWKWIPPLGRTIGIFLGGLPGSWVYAIVFSYFEGRQNTETLNAILNLSIICGGAASRAMGQAYLDFLDDPDLMPLFVALTVAPLSFVCYFLLSLAPAPSLKDESKKARRRPMQASERRVFLCKYAPGIIVMTIAYACIVTFRSFRDYFATEIYTAILGETPESWVYLAADFPAGALSSLVMLGLRQIVDNRFCLQIMLIIFFCGSAMVGVAAVLHTIDPSQKFPFIIGMGVGLYVMWAPIPSLFYDRLLAASNTQGTVVFLIFMSDLSGYIGTTGLLLYQGLMADGQSNETFKDIYVYSAMGLSCAGMFAALFCGLYFSAVLPKESVNENTSPDFDSLIDNDQDDDDDMLRVDFGTSADDADDDGGYDDDDDDNNNDGRVRKFVNTQRERK